MRERSVLPSRCSGTRRSRRGLRALFSSAKSPAHCRGEALNTMSVGPAPGTHRDKCRVAPAPEVFMFRGNASRLPAPPRGPPCLPRAVSRVDPHSGLCKQATSRQPPEIRRHMPVRESPDYLEIHIQQLDPQGDEDDLGRLGGSIEYVVGKLVVTEAVVGIPSMRSAKSRAKIKAKQTSSQ